MLARHADNLFWMARYLERSENLSRRIQATLHHALSQEDDGEEEWTILVTNEGLKPLFDEKYTAPSITNIVNFLLRDGDNSKFGLIAEKDFTPTFSGKHDNSILGVYNGDYEVAAIANSVMQRRERRGVIDPGKIRTIYKSQTFPTTGYGHAHNLHPELVAKIKTAFWTYEWDETFKKEFKKADIFVGIEHKYDWAVIRGIDKANGVSYDCK